MKVVVIGAPGSSARRWSPTHRARSPGDRGLAGIRGQHRHRRGSGPRSLTGAQVVVDVANSPSFEDGAGVGLLHHRRPATCSPRRRRPGYPTTSHCPWSGTDRLLASGYFRAKDAQEQLIREVGHPVLDRARDPVLRVRRTHRRFGDRRRHRADLVRAASSRWRPTTSQPPSPRTAVGRPVGGVLEVAGPDRYRARRPRPRPSARAQRHPPRRHRSAGSLPRGPARRPHPGTRPPPRRCSRPVSRTGSSTARPSRSGSARDTTEEISS